MSARLAGATTASLLADVPLPPGTARALHPPSWAAAPLAPPQSVRGLARAQDRHAYWVSGQSPITLLGFVDACAPAGTIKASSGSGGPSGRTYLWWEELEAPATTPLAGRREIYLQVASGGGRRYAVRLDTVVAWHMRRPPDSLVPPDVGWLRMTVTEPIPAGGRGRVALSWVTTARDAVQAAARIVNELPLAEPAGPAAHCPEMGEPQGVTLTFRRTAPGADLATVLTATDDCGQGGAASAWITTLGRRRLALTDHLDLAEPREHASLIDRVEAALGHRLHLG